MSRYVPITGKARVQHVGLSFHTLAPDPKFETERIAKALMRKPSVKGVSHKKRTPSLPKFSWDK